MAKEKFPSETISDYIVSLPDWCGKLLAQLRRTILEAAPSLAEEWKWDTPVFSHKGMSLQ